MQTAVFRRFRHSAPLVREGQGASGHIKGQKTSYNLVMASALCERSGHHPIMITQLSIRLRHRAASDSARRSETCTMAMHLSSFVVVSASTLLVAAGHASAQLTVTPPQPTATSPVYTPPPPPPPPPAPVPQPAAEPEIPTPDILVRDGAGRLQYLTAPTEELAIMKLGVRPDQKEKFEALRAERSALYDRHLTRNLPNVLKVVDSSKTIDAPADLGSTVAWLVPARATVFPLQLSKMATGANIITSREADAVQRALDSYTKAATDQARAEAASDQMKQNIEVARFNFKRMSVEPMREFNRLIDQLTAKWDASLAKATELSPEQTAAAAQVGGLTDAGAKRAAAIAFIGALPLAKAQAMLEAAWLPMPSNRLVPDSTIFSAPGAAGAGAPTPGQPRPPTGTLINNPVRPANPAPAAEPAPK